MRKKRHITTQWPAKGDLVKGHTVFAYAESLPLVQAKVIEATDAKIVIKVDTILTVLGLPRKSTWTWRQSAQKYIQKGSRTSEKSMALLLANVRAEAAA